MLWRLQVLLNYICLMRTWEIADNRRVLVFAWCHYGLSLCVILLMWLGGLQEQHRYHLLQLYCYCCCWGLAGALQLEVLLAPSRVITKHQNYIQASQATQKFEFNFLILRPATCEVRDEALNDHRWENVLPGHGYHTFQCYYWEMMDWWLPR